MSSSESKQRRIKCLRVSWLMRFVLIFCADNKRDVRLLSLFSLVFGESALRPFCDDDKEEFYEDENEVENA